MVLTKVVSLRINTDSINRTPESKIHKDFNEFLNLKEILIESRYICLLFY